MWDRQVLKGSANQLEKKQEEILEAFVKDLSFWGDLLQPPPTQKKQEQPPAKKQHRTINLSAASDVSNRDGKPIWRTATDAASGRTYYYDAITRRTQWDKPAEVREMERRRKREKKQKDRRFFNEMESNIRNSLNRGERVPGVKETDANMRAEEETPQRLRPTSQRIRTISGMDESLLQELSTPSAIAERAAKQAVPPKFRRDAHGRPPLPARRGLVPEESLDLEFSPEETRHEQRQPPPILPLPPVHPLLTREESDQSFLRGIALLDEPISAVVEEAPPLVVRKSPQQLQQNHVRRNTGGTVYAASTMMNPNIDSTIKCVCGVYRAHIVQATNKRAERSPVTVAHSLDKLADVFLDERHAHDPFSSGGAASNDVIPLLDDIIAFYKDFYMRSQMEHDTIIFSLIYAERLIKETSIAPVPNNWRSVLFSCMVLASKVWDDLSMWNIDFSNVCGRGGGLVAFNLRRINELELALLKLLCFNVKVPASEYAKYYFLIRNTLMKSGLLAEEKQAGATPAPNAPGGHRGSRSMNDYNWLEGKDSSVSVEQLLSMTKY